MKNKRRAGETGESIPPPVLVWCEEPAPEEEVEAEGAPHGTEKGKSVSNLSRTCLELVGTAEYSRGYYYGHGGDGRARREDDGATGHVTATGRGGRSNLPAHVRERLFTAADEGEAGRALTGQQPEMKRRKRYTQRRKCSARCCDNEVQDRFLWNEVAFCVPHRRHEEGVLVDRHDEPMRWCTHCKKPHNLCDFADSITGPPRKLTSCKATHAARLKRMAEKAALLREQKGTFPKETNHK